ncbi:unnamed protein product [Rotaria magnacalcarata]|nr:unnamed protein product [Rotaria magnacalcarata]CAF5202028.1 unnamed protein product [Rotaria magnacalcarata]
MKPLLTHSYPPLTVTLPACLVPITRLLTTKEQRAFNRNENLFPTEMQSFDNHDNSTLTNNCRNSTPELIDMEFTCTNPLDHYSTVSNLKSNMHTDATSVNLRTDNNGDVSAHFTSSSSSSPSKPL